MILDFEIVIKGSEIGYVSGKPILLRDFGTHSRWKRLENLMDNSESLSNKLWKQVNKSIPN